MYDLILKNVHRFIELTPEEKKLFISLLKPKKVYKRQLLFQEGNIAHYQYFVTKGCLRTYFIDNKGQEHNVQFAIEDWWTGDMHGFLTQKESRFNIIAIEDSEMLSIDKPSMEELYHKVPKFNSYFRQLLQNAFISFQDRILSGMSETAEERYVNFRKKYPSMDKRIPQNQIASFLGITPESLSRVRKNLTEKNKKS